MENDKVTPGETKLSSETYNMLLNPARNENETYEQFKAREKETKKLIKKYLKR